MKSRTIKVDYLARVEGEGSLYVKIEKDKVVDVKLKIFEPPRFFEALLRGRGFHEAPDITARICGICPIAYQMSAVHAIENGFGIKIDAELRALRRLICCGEWIESHSLHIYMLHGPDFLGYQDAIQMSKQYPEIVKRGLEIKKVGNRIVSLLGGREIHPINVRVGGFYKTPRKKDLEPLREQLLRAREAALRTVEFAASLDFPDSTRDYEFVALHHPHEYPMNEGRIISNRGLNITAEKYDENFQEEHIPYTNALHSTIIARGAYFVGPMARYNLNFDRLSPVAKEAARESGIGEKCLNPFKSIIIRSIEVLYALDEAIRIIDGYEEPTRPTVAIEPVASTGYACTEAPRGILYHRYCIDEQGQILDAKIVPPTSQNQKTIEYDLKDFIPNYVGLPDDTLQLRCEQAIRNYDPCISCATHFLNLKVERD